MSKTTFNMKIRDIETKKITTREIEGYEFDYKGIKLVIHKAVDSKTIWTASEPQTGMNAAITSKKDAIQRMKDRVDTYTPEKIKEAIDKNLEYLKNAQ